MWWVFIDTARRDFFSSKIFFIAFAYFAFVQESLEKTFSTPFSHWDPFFWEGFIKKKRWIPPGDQSSKQSVASPEILFFLRGFFSKVINSLTWALSRVLCVLNCIRGTVCLVGVRLVFVPACVCVTAYCSQQSKAHNATPKKKKWHNNNSHISCEVCGVCFVRVWKNKMGKHAKNKEHYPKTKWNPLLKTRGARCEAEGLRNFQAFFFLEAFFLSLFFLPKQIVFTKAKTVGGAGSYRFGAGYTGHYGLLGFVQGFKAISILAFLFLAKKFLPK